MVLLIRDRLCSGPSRHGLRDELRPACVPAAGRRVKAEIMARPRCVWSAGYCTALRAGGNLYFASGRRDTAVPCPAFELSKQNFMPPSEDKVVHSAPRATQPPATVLYFVAAAGPVSAAVASTSVVAIIVMIVLRIVSSLNGAARDQFAKHLVQAL
jgi:hypothetical protein